MSGDLVAFLTARLDEDEAAAKAAERAFSMNAREPRRACSPWIAAGSLLLAAQPDGSHGDVAEVVNYGLDEVLQHAARHDPARVLREVEAKRAILAEHAPVCAGIRPCDTLRALAAVYSDHPDYDPAWAVIDAQPPAVAW